MSIAAGIENRDHTACFFVVVKLRFTAKNFTVLIKNLHDRKKLSVAAENNIEDENCVVDAVEQETHVYPNQNQINTKDP
jgi:hypothetical protein